MRSSGHWPGSAAAGLSCAEFLSLIHLSPFRNRSSEARFADVDTEAQRVWATQPGSGRAGLGCLLSTLHPRFKTSSSFPSLLPREGLQVGGSSKEAAGMI